MVDRRNGTSPNFFSNTELFQVIPHLKTHLKRITNMIFVFKNFELDSEKLKQRISHQANNNEYLLNKIFLMYAAK